jgi:Acyl-CoA thioesterase C-terminal domain/Acyl-CoA thioesterase N-terminal domain
MIGGVPDPFYVPPDGPDGDRFHATVSTTGPWFADAQHAGPPSALLVRALERCAPQPGTTIGRVAVDVLGPVPAGEVTVRAGVERPGRAVTLLAAELDAGGRTAMRARAWRLATGDTAAVTVGAVPPLPPPDTARLRTERPPGWLPGFVDALEWRWLQGWLGDPGPGTVWTRQRVPLVDGEEPSPLQRLMLVADSANGAAAPLDIRAWLFLNTELTVHLHRPPTGTWTAVDAQTTVGPQGIGTVAGLLFDEHGHVGRSAQCLTVRPR